MNTYNKKELSLFNNSIERSAKEKLLRQHSKVIWLTGLPCSGKTTISLGLEKELYKRGFITQVLDGDNIRNGLNKNLSFTLEDRLENIRRIAEVSKLFINSGIITINGFISPTEEIRILAKKIIGEDNFIEVFVNSSLSVCELRDTKGLYKKARKGEINNFTGVSAGFEPPKAPDIELRTDKLTIEESINKVLNFILPELKKEF